MIKAIDESNFASGIFIDLQKAFDTVDHYGVKGIAFSQLNSGVALI